MEKEFASMLGWFPTPYPDELLYSLLARYQEQMGYRRFQSVSIEFFGRPWASASIDLPNRLDYLATQIPSNSILSAEELIDKHTLLPFYSHFHSFERVMQVRLRMKQEGNSYIHSYIGFAGSKVCVSNYFRYCPKCVIADRKCYGETYWHRAHQLTGVEVCPIHKVFIVNSTLLTRLRANSSSYYSAENIVPLYIPISTISINDSDDLALLHIAEDSYWLLSQRQEGVDFQRLYDFYILLLLNNGFATFGGEGKIGSIKYARLKSLIKSTFSDEILRRLQSNFDENKRYGWVTRLFMNLQADHSIHPLRHLILIHSLGFRVQEFFELYQKNQKRTSITTKPTLYPCLNPVCQHYRKLVISKVKTYPYLRNRKIPILTIACECGFTYSRKGLNQSSDDMFRYDYINSRGELWYEKLRELWNNYPGSVNEIARRLGASFNTIKHHAAGMGLQFPRGNGKAIKVTMPKRLQNAVQKGYRRFKQDQEIAKRLGITLKYREIWLAAINKHSEASRNELIRQYATAYTWLCYNDNEWLKINKPPALPQPTLRKVINWKSRDEELAKEVKAASESLKNAPGIPVKISARAIARKLLKPHLFARNALNKLEVTQIVLNEVVETPLTYAIRKIDWAVYDLYKMEKPLSFGRIMSHGKITTNLRHLPEIKDAIESAILSLAQKTKGRMG